MPIVGAKPLFNMRRCGVRKWVSKTTRIGCFPHLEFLLLKWRISSYKCITPTSIAIMCMGDIGEHQHVLLHPVIHLLSPVTVAVFSSSSSPLWFFWMVFQKGAFRFHVVKKVSDLNNILPSASKNTSITSISLPLFSFSVTRNERFYNRECNYNNALNSFFRWQFTARCVVFPKWLHGSSVT